MMKKTFLRSLAELDDSRQQWKVKHRIGDIVGIVLFATLANANDWQEIGIFAKENAAILKRYFKLENGIPSHDTIQRVMATLSPKKLQELQMQWQEMLNTDEGEKLIKILNIDGKTMRGSGSKDTKPLHIVSAWLKEDGVCLGQVTVNEKSNEITAIPELLKMLNINGQIVTIDAMGTQTAITEQIVKQKGQYVLAVKGNQGILFQDIIDYFEINEKLDMIKQEGGYKRTKEKARSQIETREYYQTNDIKWLSEKKKWRNLKTIGMVKTTLEKDGKVSEERRYYISSLVKNIEDFSRAVRGHWAVESMHWQLDVTFKEDSNQTIDKRSNENLNIIRKWSLSMLKLLDMGEPLSMKLKRYRICCNLEKYIVELLMM